MTIAIIETANEKDYNKNYVSGPPFWYFGPTPPNETILEEAAQLALNLTEEIKRT